LTWQHKREEEKRMEYLGIGEINGEQRIGEGKKHEWKRKKETVIGILQ
jgi:hypothetical protein